MFTSTLNTVFVMVKVLVVGAGPAGTLSAINLAEKAEITLIDQKKHVGFPTQCAGLISSDCYSRLKKYGVKKSKIKKIRGALFFSPNGQYVEAEGKCSGVLIERKIFDQELLIRASDYVKVEINTKFLGIDGNRVILRKNTIEKAAFDYIIGCDGVNSIVAKCFGFKRPEILYAVQAELKFEAMYDDMVEIYFGKKYSDCFFSYAIPVDEFAKIGVISKSNVLERFKKLINTHPSITKRINYCKVVELNVGSIPIGLINFVKDNVALVGDSAGMVKPYTGGGIYYHLVAAEKLGQNFPNLSKYRLEYLRELGREYKIGMIIYKLYSILDDEDYNMLVRKIKKYDLSELHMDRPSTLLKNPKLFAGLLNLKILTKLFKSIMGSKFLNKYTSFPQFIY